MLLSGPSAQGAGAVAQRARSRVCAAATAARSRGFGARRSSGKKPAQQHDSLIDEFRVVVGGAERPIAVPNIAPKPKKQHTKQAAPAADQKQQPAHGQESHHLLHQQHQQHSQPAQHSQQQQEQAGVSSAAAGAGAASSAPASKLAAAAASQQAAASDAHIGTVTSSAPAAPAATAGPAAPAPAAPRGPDTSALSQLQAAHAELLQVEGHVARLASLLGDANAALGVLLTGGAGDGAHSSGSGGGGGSGAMGGLERELVGVTADALADVEGELRALGSQLTGANGSFGAALRVLAAGAPAPASSPAPGLAVSHVPTGAAAAREGLAALAADMLQLEGASGEARAALAARIRQVAALLGAPTA